MSYVPTAPEPPNDDESTARVLEFGTERADDVLQILSSGTAQDLVSVLQDGPVTANDVDTTLQNVHYPESCPQRLFVFTSKSEYAALL
jgi:hypothetical protein